MNANENHRANIEKAFNCYMLSSFFNGHVYPKHFYNFCEKTEGFEKINNMLCNRVQLSIKTLSMKVGASFRTSGPSTKTVSRAKYYLKRALLCARGSNDIYRDLKRTFQDDYGDFTRYIPPSTVEYMANIEFSIDSLPALIRDDYKKFFKKMQDAKLTAASQYIDFMRDTTVPLEVREEVIDDEPGFIYCFVTSYKAETKGYSVLKVGRTKRGFDRILSHKGRMAEHQIAHLTHTSAMQSSEKKLIRYFEMADISNPFYDPKTRRKAAEMFEVPELYVHSMFESFLTSL